jgi:hypothetical protein
MTWYMISLASGTLTIGAGTWSGAITGLARGRSGGDRG